MRVVGSEMAGPLVGNNAPDQFGSRIAPNRIRPSRERCRFNTEASGARFVYLAIERAVARPIVDGDVRYSSGHQLCSAPSKPGAGRWPLSTKASPFDRVASPPPV